MASSKDAIKFAVGGTVPPCPMQLANTEISSLRDELLVLDTEMTHDLGSLRQTIDRLRAHSNHRRLLVQRLEVEIITRLPKPLHNLPQELLCEILIYSAHASAHPMYLCHIDKWTRAVALKTQGVWQNVFWRYQARKPSHGLDMLDVVKRSGSLPLFISSQIPILARWKEVAELAYNRIVSIELSGIVLSRLDDSDAQGICWEALERLSLTNYTRSQFAYLGPILKTQFTMFSQAPKLSHVLVHFPFMKIPISNLHLPWDHISHLHICSRDSFSKTASTIRLCTRLQSLDIFLSPVSMTFAMDPIDLPLLTTLSIQGGNSDIICGFRAPNLLSLSVVAPPLDPESESTIADSLQLFLTDSNCPLQSLALEADLSLFEEHHIQGVFGILQKLQSLQLKLGVFSFCGRGDTTNFFSSFVATLSPPNSIFGQDEPLPSPGRPHTNLLPNLTSFELTCPHPTYDNKQSLTRFIQSRIPPTSTRAGVTDLKHCRVWVLTSVDPTQFGPEEILGVPLDIQGIILGSLSGESVIKEITNPAMEKTINVYYREDSEEM